MAEGPVQHPVSSGVEELLGRLREDGVAAGRHAAEQLLTAARQEAQRLVGESRAEAERTLAAATAEVQRRRTAGEQALQLAARDAVLSLEIELERRFRDALGRLVASELACHDLLVAMLLEWAGRCRPAIEATATAELLLPEALTTAALRADPDAAAAAPATVLARAIAGGMLRDGVTLRGEPGQAAGITVAVGDQGVVLDLGAEAITELLLEHLQPPFRALLEGLVR